LENFLGHPEGSDLIENATGRKAFWQVELLFANISAEFLEEVYHIRRTFVNHPLYDVTKMIEPAGIEDWVMY